MHRQTYRTGGWRPAVASVLTLFAGLLLPALALTGHRTVGLGITVLVPVVLLPLAYLAFYYGLIRRLRIDIDATGITVTRGPRSLSLPWSAVRSVGVLPEGTRGQPVTVLILWPTVTPPPPSTRSPIVFDRDLGAYAVAQLAHLSVTEHELSAAVELASPGTWGTQP